VRFAPPFRIGWSVLALLLLATPDASFAGKPKPPSRSHPVHLTDSDLFDRLARVRHIRAYRLHGEWSGRCDSVLLTGGSPMECFTRTADVSVPDAGAASRLLSVLASCTWTRSKGWGSPSPPTLGLRLEIEKDSLDAELLVSVLTMNATLWLPGQGSMAAALPESAFSDVARALRRIDPGNPEACAAITAELRARGIHLLKSPPPEDWGDDGVPCAVTEDGELTNFDEPPVPVSQSRAIYPEMAKEAQIQGRVVLHALIGKDGRVKSTRIVRSVNYLDAAARDAVGRWIYKPALLRGAPVSAWIEVPVEFGL
jgi:TonB family protein